ncbi:DMT family transporter [Rhizobium sp. YS-1r]|uniref:DMT family transporter n=1 Tax=Neorhizobium phenanthreniclasticum TaxID=3157917 RepID=A0ABV0LZI9_9HYPH|nr:DMT family transporter [Rhizobium sp. YS-1r]
MEFAMAPGHYSIKKTLLLNRMDGMPIGILAALATCALWGLTFVAPRAVDPFTPWDLAVARYGLFGVASFVLMANRRFRPVAFSAGRIAVGLGLGCLGYVGYFLAVAYAVRLAGAAVPPLVIGTMPVLLALIANWRDDTVRWRSLALPFSLIVAGVLVVNLDALSTVVPQGRGMVLLGALSAVAALAIWIVYGLANGIVMRACDAPDALRWTGVQGLGAALGSLVILPFTNFGEISASPSEISRFAGWALLTGLAGSWFATWCWVVASRRLPIALAAQLIVAETVFGLAYGFMFEARWPSGAEWVGAALQIFGVAAAIRAFTLPCAPDARWLPKDRKAKTEAAG